MATVTTIHPVVNPEPISMSSAWAWKKEVRLLRYALTSTASAVVVGRRILATVTAKERVKLRSELQDLYTRVTASEKFLGDVYPKLRKVERMLRGYAIPLSPWPSRKTVEEVLKAATAEGA